MDQPCRTFDPVNQIGTGLDSIIVLFTDCRKQRRDHFICDSESIPSEPTLSLTLAEIYVRGVSTFKVNAIHRVDPSQTVLFLRPTQIQDIGDTKTQMRKWAYSRCKEAFYWTICPEFLLDHPFHHFSTNDQIYTYRQASLVSPQSFFWFTIEHLRINHVPSQL